ncbi:hypothetical protein EHQ83_17910 [Leptospira yasudae]|uniref:Uncharacterized protein n=1 Tax=Leptospira yasudae TaxID=2202201 RepID=A0A6N4QKK7_9LEPT|nr:hypothetical protein EHQ72_14440 [Leptospira yasudae]TGL79744.1 hypothetical protein EHQ83_17910 [Leptospira yasudae]TGL80100.1 hypothetical protein EHQ77_08955 [Leptospira yasudae]
MILTSTFTSHNFVSSLRSGSLMRPSLRAKATLLCHFGSRDATKVARTSCQPFAHRRFRAATSRRLFR